ncbi:MAG TPA: CoA pyrophosphatase [Geomonas sp.]|nr:CoA pyrophosphatase [Geomonas sp.]
MRKVHEIQKALSSQPFRTIDPDSRSQAAVALLLEETPAGLNLLLIERAANENDYWSGQIALPGGRREKADGSPQDTAQRETREEIGLDLAKARYLGRLSDFAPAGLKIVISTFVYAIDGRPELTADPQEIAEAFWFPVQEIRNPARFSQVQCHFRNRLMMFPAVNVGKRQPLWGITFRLLRNLEKVVERKGTPPLTLPRKDERS